ncbi:MAG: methyltransferase domain-containing protein [Gammaproteobacteria bacterium]|nr:methyltransferase domain-containing protein [Gammaproteobacteria bacterium]
MGLRASYTLFSPIYDALVGPATAPMRRASLARLAGEPPGRVLFSGIGTGLDIPALPPQHEYVGLDLTPAMLQRARRRAARAGRRLALQVGDVHALPYADACFDAVVMHLILAVAGAPERTLAEAARVLRPGRRMLVVDKFLRPGQRAPLRRWVSPWLARVATRTDVVLEDALRCCPELTIETDRALAGRGWFREVVVVKAEAAR